MVCFEDKLIIWGNIKDEKTEGEDFELVLIAPSSKMYHGGRAIEIQGELKRGSRKKETDFVITHDAMILS